MADRTDAAAPALPAPIESALRDLVSVAIEAVGDGEAAVVDALDGAILREILPPAMTPAIHEALGLSNFRCGPIAEVYRAAGHPIRRKAEDEQAFVLFRYLRLALRHGPGWFAESCVDLDAAVKAATANRHGEAGSTHDSANQP